MSFKFWKEKMYEIFSRKLRHGSSFVICLYSCFRTMEYWVLNSSRVALVTTLYTSFCDPMDWGARHLCLWDFPSKNTGVGCYFHLTGVFLTQELNPEPLYPVSPELAGGFFTTEPLGKPARGHHTHTYTLTHTHTLSHTHKHTLTHTLTHTHSHSHTLTHTHTHSHIHSHTLTLTHTLTHTHSHTHTHTHTHSHTFTHSHTHTHIHTLTHTLTHTHTKPWPDCTLYMWPVK